MSDKQEYSEEYKKLLKYINDTPELLSTLYDWDLLPEQVQPKTERCNMMIQFVVWYREVYSKRIVELEEQKNGYCSERNKTLVGLCSMAIALGFPAYTMPHDGEVWGADWRNIVVIEGPTGQMSWHVHDSEMDLFKGLPHTSNNWDGHDTEEKYRRVIGLSEHCHAMRRNLEAQKNKAWGEYESASFFECADAYNDLARGIMADDEAWFDEFVELCKRYYENWPTGGTLHIVLDDGNINDDHVGWCAGYAHGLRDGQASDIANLMSLMTEKQRRKVVDSRSLYA